MGILLFLNTSFKCYAILVLYILCI
ncbi:hypothetical protein F383_24936 [Gossypium arboreum]|uniref:Uncharacterized protein n=1 Tax=Gossypium arboreum TaxID=29729 RepID=A0A0B0P895_GOSAR|nr:hypothetical protein F383_24936 [Gossypium arboreum]